MSAEFGFGSRPRGAGLVTQNAEWGISVSESAARRGYRAKAMALGRYVLFLGAAITSLPILAGALAFPTTKGLLTEAAIIAAGVGLASFLMAQSKKGPRNALQLDYAACEVRLGSQDPNGVFTRHRVISFGSIGKVFIDRKAPGGLALCLQLDGEVVAARFADVSDASLTLLASQISAARESSRKMPVRSRIRSALVGFEASARETGQRVRSRIVSRAV